MKRHTAGSCFPLYTISSVWRSLTDWRAAEDMEVAGVALAGEVPAAAVEEAGAATSAAEDGSSLILPATWTCTVGHVNLQ